MSPQTSGMQSMRSVWIFIFLLAAGLWSVHIGRPVDLPAWHEFDYSSIARNFVREGNNILYPRIDWRGDGPGFTEMEFPVIPWAMAQLYRVFGLHEIFGRILSYVFMLLSLAVFSRIALRVLPAAAAAVSALFFVVGHEVVQVATAIQPESLMLLFYLMSVYFFITWYETQRRTAYWLSIVSFSCAMLVKSPASHLAIFFLLWALQKDGLRAFRRPSLYAFAALSFAPVILWYAHAAGLWHQFHNSMGLSNQDHWIGLDIFKRPKVFASLISIDGLLVCGGGGLLLAIYAVWKDRLSSAANRLALSWCLAIAIYMLVIIRTAGAYWAAYYHVIAVPPIGLLFGVGVMHLQRKKNLPWRRIFVWSGALAAFLVAALAAEGKRDITHLPGVFQDLLSAHSSPLNLGVLAVLSVLVTVLSLYLSKMSDPHSPEEMSSNTAVVLFVGCFTYFFLSGQLLLGTWKSFAAPSPQFVSALCLKNLLAPQTLIVSSGGVCADAGGHRVASDAPNMFYWLDRKGFTTCEGQESVAELQGLVSRGARYFIADKTSLLEQPAFESELRKSFALMADCDTSLLFDLQSRPR